MLGDRRPRSARRGRLRARRTYRVAFPRHTKGSPRTTPAAPEGTKETTVHVVIMGCGRVGSTLADGLEELGHSVAIIDIDAHAFRRLSPHFRGRKIHGVGPAPQRARGVRYSPGRRVRGREQRRQLEHHRGAGGPRDVRRRERRRPHLRHPPRRDLPAARNSDGGDGEMDRRPDAAPGAPGRRPGPVARPDRDRSARRGPRRPRLDRAPAHRHRGRDRRPGWPSSPGSARARSRRPTRCSRTATC